MNKNGLFALLGLTTVWIILMEELSLFTIATGLGVSLACLLVARKFIPLSKIQDVRFIRLVFYPLRLIWEIYAQGFGVIKLILTGAKAEIVSVDLSLKSDFLKAILMSFITTTPGSTPLDLENDTMAVLLLVPNGSNNAQELAENEVRLMEGRLIKAQK